MVYCGIFTLLSLIGMINFFVPSQTTCCTGLTFFLTGGEGTQSIEQLAKIYCTEYAITGSSTTSQGLPNLGYTCDSVCMCDGAMCDFTAQASQHFTGYIIQFSVNIVWIVTLIAGIVVAAVKSAMGVAVVTGVSILLFIIQIIGGAIVTAAPTNVLKAFFLWAGTALPDWNGNPTAGTSRTAESWADPTWQCNETWETNIDGFLSFSQTFQWVFCAIFLVIFARIVFIAYMVRSDILKGVSGKGTGSAPDATSGVTVTATKKNPA